MPYENGGLVSKDKKKKNKTLVDVLFGSSAPTIEQIEWSKENEKLFKKYISKGYIDKKGMFVSPYGDTGPFSATNTPGYRWAHADGFMQSVFENGKFKNVLRTPWVLKPFDGTEAMWKGGKRTISDYNPWNAKAETLRTNENTGFLGMFKGLGYNALSLATDFKNTIKNIPYDTKTLFNSKAPGMVRVGSGINVGLNLAPFIKTGGSLVADSIAKNIGDLGVNTIGQGLERTAPWSKGFIETTGKRINKPSTLINTSDMLKNMINGDFFEGKLPQFINAPEMPKVTPKAPINIPAASFGKSKSLLTDIVDFGTGTPTKATQLAIIKDLSRTKNKLDYMFHFKNGPLGKAHARMYPDIYFPPGDLDPSFDGLYINYILKNISTSILSDSPGNLLNRQKQTEFWTMLMKKAKTVRFKHSAVPETFLGDIVQASIAGGSSLNTNANAEHLGGWIDLSRALFKEKVIFEKGTQLFRGISVDKSDELLQLKPGDIFPHMGIIRTSVDPKIAFQFSRLLSDTNPAYSNQRGIFMAIDVPKDTPYYAADVLSYEKEVMLPSSLLKIKRIEELTDGSRVMRMELLEDIFNNFDISKFKKSGDKKGFNPGGFYLDAFDQEFYIKEAVSRKAGLNEELAARLYEFLGIPTLGQRHFVGVDKKSYIVSKVNDKLSTYAGTQGDSITQIAKKFVVDALLGNYDTVGSIPFSNWQYAPNRFGQYSPVAVDTGASLFYRGTGGLKSARKGIQFGEHVEELNALFDPNYEDHPSFRNAADFFNSFTNLKMEIPTAIRNLQRDFDYQRFGHPKDRNYIYNIIEDVYSNIPNSKIETDKLYELLQKRLQNMAERGKVYEEALRNAINYNLPRPAGFANGGIVPGFGSQGVPALLHGGEYVINSSAVKNIGFAALQAMNNMRFNTPKSPTYSGPVSGKTTSTSTTHIYVDNFIGEKQWFESMMKDYNINIAPQNQRAAGLNNATISTYSGINRGL